MELNIFKVYVKCNTYNQASYIDDALNGFCMQKTLFPYICLVFDDASTDGETDVINKYMQKNFDLNDKSVMSELDTEDYHLTFAQHLINKNCFFAVYYLKYNHHSIKKSKWPYFNKMIYGAKYAAICEGDDYWTDPFKIQKQYDMMENHPEYSLCFHAHHELFPDGTLSERHPIISKKCYSTEDIIPKGGSFAATNSLFYRTGVMVNKVFPDFWKNAPVGDGPRMLYYSTVGLLGYINETMSVHRFQAKNSWTLRQNVSIKRKWVHYKRMSMMYDSFDKYTDMRYHELIEVKKKKMKKHAVKSILGIVLKGRWYKN